MTLPSSIFSPLVFSTLIGWPTRMDPALTLPMTILPKKSSASSIVTSIWKLGLGLTFGGGTVAHQTDGGVTQTRKLGKNYTQHTPNIHRI